jgi:transcriptional regulator with XRE-family HTH domain
LSNFYKKIRENYGLSQARFAKLIGVTVTAVSHWENGISKPSYSSRMLMVIPPNILLKAHDDIEDHPELSNPKSLKNRWNR